MERTSGLVTGALCFILTTLLAFPCASAVIWLADEAIGQAAVRQWLLFDSRRVMLEQFVHDWQASLPLSAGAAALAYAIARLLQRRLPALVLLALVLALAVLASVLAGGGLVVFVAAGVVLGCALLSLAGLRHG